MIATLKGIVTEIGLRSAVVETGGLGYEVFMTADTLHGLAIGKEIAVWTHHAVREDSADLYGFLSRADRNFFELLLTVSGIGPKSALNIMSLVTSDALISSIQTGSVTHLVKVSGIGKKTAEKIVLELRDKVGSLDTDATGALSAGMSTDMDAILALQALGYDGEEAREALKKVSKDISDIGAKVKAALKVLG